MAGGGSRTVHLFVRRHETQKTSVFGAWVPVVMSATSAARAEVFPMDNRRTSPEKTPLFLSMRHHPAPRA